MGIRVERLGRVVPIEESISSTKSSKISFVTRGVVGFLGAGLSRLGVLAPE